MNGLPIKNLYLGVRAVCQEATLPFLIVHQWLVRLLVMFGPSHSRELFLGSKVALLFSTLHLPICDPSE